MWSTEARSLTLDASAMKLGATDALAQTKLVDEQACRSEVVPSRTSLAPGCVLGDRYRIERQLGEGAMGAVFLAEHTLMHKRVAIKVLHAEMGGRPEVVARFEREAVAASHIEHPNIAAAKDFGKLDGGSFFLVLEYLEGISLRDALDQYGALPPRRALHIATQVCAALVGAHALGIVHRDLKPENIMLIDRGDDPDFVKVLDFGIARVPMDDLISRRRQHESVLTRAGMIYGTPEYMAPEQALGETVDARADLYSLGILLFEMLTGSRPFEAPNEVLMLAAQATAPVPSMQDRRSGTTVDLRLEAFVRHLLEKSPADRPTDAYAVEEALLEFSSAYPTHVTRRGSFRPPPPNAAPLDPAPALPSLSGGRSESRTSAGELPEQAASLTPSASDAMLARLGKRKAFTRIVGGVLAMGTVLTGIAFSRVAPADTPSEMVLSGSATSRGPILPASPVAAGSDLPAVEQITTSALRHFERCEVQTGRSMLDRAGTNVGMPEFQRAIAAGCFARGNTAAALTALTQLANTQPEEAVGPPYLLEIEKAATVPTTMGAAYTLLEGHPTAAVTDALYRLTFAPNAPASIARAEKALLLPRVRKQASRPLTVALALKEAGQDCEAVQYFGEAADVGDGRALAYLDLLEPLHSITFRKVPGQKKPVAIDAYACLHRNGALVKAIASIKSRLARAN